MDKNTKIALAGAAIAKREREKRNNHASSDSHEKGNLMRAIFGIFPLGDAILLLAIVFLFLEILKSTSTGTSTIINHAISMMLFIVCLIQFLLLPNFATSTFFILMSMALLDVLAGVVVTIVSARRDFGVAGDV